VGRVLGARVQRFDGEQKNAAQALSIRKATVLFAGVQPMGERVSLQVALVVEMGVGAFQFFQGTFLGQNIPRAYMRARW